jgi:hypothetical protein
VILEVVWGMSFNVRAPQETVRHHTAIRVAGLAVLVLVSACAQQGDPLRYRLANSGTRWDVAGHDHVLDDLLPRYPDYFAVALDPTRSDDPPVRQLRDDLEHRPVDRRNFDALNALAIGYFELNYRSEAFRDDRGVAFLTGGIRAAHMLAIPWRAYGEIQDPSLRDAILDFYQDAGTGAKLGASATAGRLVRIVRSLAAKESDSGRRQRIETLAGRLETLPQVVEQPR